MSGQSNEFGKISGLEQAPRAEQGDKAEYDGICAQIIDVEELLDRLEERLNEVEDSEPEDDGGDEYKVWKQQCDDLAAIIEEYEDKLDGLEERRDELEEELDEGNDSL